MLYARKINLKNKNDSNVLLFDMVNFGSRVLDVGCACGDLSAVLAQEKKCSCVGMEADDEGVQICRKRNIFAEVIQIDLNKFQAKDYSRFISSFDVIVCGDVLEHLVNPQAVLSELKKLLKPDGYFVVSLPNVAHASIKIGLLFDEWNYGELGILDKTHLRFFEANSIAEMFANCGLSIAEAGCTLLPEEGFQPHKLSELPPEVADFIMQSPQSKVFQYVFKTKVAKGSLREKNLKVLLSASDGVVCQGGFLFKIKRFLLLKFPSLVKYIQKYRSH